MKKLKSIDIKSQSKKTQNSTKVTIIDIFLQMECSLMIHKDLFGQEEEIERKQFLSYDNIPTETRYKVFYVICENVYFFETFYTEGNPTTHDYQNLRYEICKNKGIPNISDIDDDQMAINEWILNCSSEDLLRTIELFIYIKKHEISVGPKFRLSGTIDDINEIFRIDKIGYEIVNERFVRKNSEFLHEHVTKPTINLLYTNEFKGPLEEFQKALDHYIKGEYKDTIQEANNSFESTMKSVLTKLNISFNQNGSADLLLDVLCNKKIIYTYTKPLFQGLPKLRNNQSGHGQGIDPKEINQSYAELALNLAGSFIVFLITRYQEMTKGT